MAISDSPLRQKQRANGKRKKFNENNVTNQHWSDSQKIEAVTTYLALGNLALTASVLKIPEITMRGWKAKQWWKDLEGELRLQDELQLSARLKKIIDSTLTVTEDRIRNGDFIYDGRSGQLIRKPVSMKDAHKVAMDMIDKRDILINKVPSSVSIEAAADKLEKLAQKFAEIASGRRPIEVTDVIIATESGRTANTGGRTGTNSVGERIDNDLDGILERGDTEGTEGTLVSSETTNA